MAKEPLEKTVEGIDPADLQRFADQKRAEQVRRSLVEIVNITLRPISIMPPSANGKGAPLIRVEPFQTLAVPDAYFQQIKGAWKRKHGEKFNPVTYREPQFDLVAKVGDSTTSFKDKSTGREFDTCKQIGTYKSRTRQKGINLSVAQAQGLIGRLSNVEMLREYLSIDLRPMVQVYGSFVLQRREKELELMQGLGRQQ